MELSANGNSSPFTIYQSSVSRISENMVFMANFGQDDYLIADKNFGFFGDEFSHQGKIMIKAELNHQNACILRKYFLYTAPIPVLQKKRTFGLGDRLGNATAGHIRTIKKYENITPVLAQQSTRELKLTGRTFSEVLDSVSFAVFRCGYKNGFGADGDHLKTEAEVRDALESGYSMITLDCSDHIQNEIYSMSDMQINEMYVPDKEQENIYLGKRVKITDDVILDFDEIEFKRMALIFNQAINFAQSIFKKYFKNMKIRTDFEISIDETLFPTTPNQHYFVANELIRRGVKISTLAPHFCGDFQKGIDYIGDIGQFEKEFKSHALIAKYFNYKISVHSGSDKFSVYPIVERLTKGNFHIKTSGTSWLEAMRSISILDPVFFREIHKYALTVFDEALRYYHITTNFTDIPDIDDLTDEELPELLNNDAARQLIHICYGLILNLKDDHGDYIFRKKLFETWKENEALYFDILDKHIGKHLSLVC